MVFRMVLSLWEFVLDVVAVSRLTENGKDLDILLWCFWSSIIRSKVTWRDCGSDYIASAKAMQIRVLGEILREKQKPASRAWCGDTNSASRQWWPTSGAVFQQAQRRQRRPIYSQRDSIESARRV